MQSSETDALKMLSAVLILQGHAQEIIHGSRLTDMALFPARKRSYSRSQKLRTLPLTKSNPLAG